MKKLLVLLVLGFMMTSCEESKPSITACECADTHLDQLKEISLCMEDDSKVKEIVDKYKLTLSSCDALVKDSKEFKDEWLACPSSIEAGNLAASSIDQIGLDAEQIEKALESLDK